VGGWGWWWWRRVRNFWKPTRSAWLCGALRVNFEIFKILPPTQKCLKILPQFKKFGRKLNRSASYMYTRSALGGALWVSVKFQKKMNFVPAQLTRRATGSFTTRSAYQTHRLRVSWGRAPPPGLQLTVAH
jgi:hypothetical protein